jgi:hypothetical protein
MTLTFTIATAEDEPTVRQLQAESTAWLASLGTDQWQPAAMRAGSSAAPTNAA